MYFKKQFNVYISSTTGNINWKVNLNHKYGNSSLFAVRKVKCQIVLDSIWEICLILSDLYNFNICWSCAIMFRSHSIYFIPYFRFAKRYKPWPMSMCKYCFVYLYIDCKCNLFHVTNCFNKCSYLISLPFSWEMILINMST